MIDQAILDARTLYLNRSFANSYDEIIMPRCHAHV